MMLARVCALVPCLLLAAAAAAQEPYPTRPIALVVPFPPGGVADLTARPVAAALEKVLKAPVGVVNKQRAAGAVGMQSVATGTPEPVLAKLRDAARAAVEEPSFKAAMDKLETPIVFKQGEEFRRFFEADARRLGEGVRRVGKVETQ